MKNSIKTVLLASVTVGLLFSANSAYADDADKEQIRALQAQIQVLTQQLDTLSRKVDAQAAAETRTQKQSSVEAKAQGHVQAAMAAKIRDKESITSGEGKEIAPGVKVKVSGFIETAAINRSKNETTDVASNFNTAIPFNNSVNAHQGEFRASARQSRITMLLSGKYDEATTLSGYVESDFLGAAPTANSTESNSYNPRVRVLYSQIDNSDWGLHFLVGQEWSLLTMNKSGITPRAENIPLTIDAQYVPGFNWTRNPQARVVKDFDDHRIELGASAEAPQASLGGITPPAAVNVTNTGVSPLSSASYSTDYAPDLIAKAAFDPGWGHYEVFGLARFFHDIVVANDQNNTAVGKGIGGGAILPVIPKTLDLQASIMAGKGIGRYGSVQLPDFALNTDGTIHPLSEVTWLVGAVGHPAEGWDTYIYAGEESVKRFSVANTSYGYGDFGLNNAPCDVAGGTCPAQTKDVWQITPGAWKEIYKGNLGLMKIGFQDSITRRDAFSDSNGIAPHAYENVALLSFRFYPQ